MKRNLLTAVILATLFTVSGARAQEDPSKITLDRPGPREFVIDRANLLNAAAKQRIQEICDKLLTEKATPIIVVTINSMAEHNGAGMRIESFATLLFNQWGIGVAELNGQTWNTGILLLVSKDDRKARIELGGYWRRDQDALAQQIMNDQIVPRFKQGDFSGGIVAGVESLDKMARGLQLPKAPTPPTPWWMYALMIGAVALAIFTVISLIRRGSSGWAWLLWAAVFAAIGYMLYQMATSRGDGGGYSGGSFGGGSSGGGGATGSW